MNRLQHAREMANICASLCIVIAFIAWCWNGLSTPITEEQKPLVGQPAANSDSQVFIKSPSAQGDLEVWVSRGSFYVKAPPQLSLPAMVYGAVK